jgi:hypothetical protein
METMIPGVQKPYKSRREKEVSDMDIRNKSGTEPIRVSADQPHCKQRTALRSVHIDHSVLHGMHVVTLYGTDTLDRRHMASIGREYRHQASVDRKVPVIVSAT